MTMTDDTQVIDGTEYPDDDSITYDTEEQNEEVSPFDLSWGAVCDAFKPDLMSAYHGALAAKAAAEDEGFVAAFTAWKEAQRLASDTDALCARLQEIGADEAAVSGVRFAAHLHAATTVKPKALDFDRTVGDLAVGGLRSILALPQVVLTEEEETVVLAAIAAWEQVKGTAKVKVPGSGSGSGSASNTTTIPPIEVLYGGVKVGGSGVDASPAWSSTLSNIATKLDTSKVMSRAQFKPLREDVKDALNRVLADGTRVDLANGFTVRRAV